MQAEDLGPSGIWSRKAPLEQNRPLLAGRNPRRLAGESRVKTASETARWQTGVRPQPPQERRGPSVPSAREVLTRLRTTAMASVTRANPGRPPSMESRQASSRSIHRAARQKASSSGQQRICGAEVVGVEKAGSTAKTIGLSTAPGRPGDQKGQGRGQREAPRGTPAYHLERLGAAARHAQPHQGPEPNPVLEEVLRQGQTDEKEVCPSPTSMQISRDRSGTKIRRTASLSFAAANGYGPPYRIWRTPKAPPLLLASMIRRKLAAMMITIPRLTRPACRW